MTMNLLDMLHYPAGIAGLVFGAVLSVLAAFVLEVVRVNRLEAKTVTMQR